jgi:hypothetical protein
MNLQYLESMPEVAVETSIAMEEDEKVVFAATLGCFGDHNDRMLGKDAPMLMTNKRIMMYNGAGLFTIGLAEDIAECKKVKTGFWIFKSEYFAITLKEEMSYADGQGSLTGFHLYFYDEAVKARFTDIVSKVFGK